MRRDRLTFAMIVGVPILQLVLFGYAINADPKALPTAVVDHDRSVFSRSLVQAIANTGYFRVVAAPGGEDEADRLLGRGDVQFAIVVPPGFARELQRGERPVLLVAADATDPAATGNALAALTALGGSALRARPDRPAARAGARAPRPSRSACSAATTRRASRSTTSCPACWG